MSKPSKLLKVVSIIVIVFGALGILGSILNIVMASTMGDIIQESYETLGMEAPSAASYAFSAIFACITLVTGIVGVLHKSKKSVLIMAALYLIIQIGNILYSTVTVGFSFLYVINLILPVLYMWGWYQSE